MAFVVEDGTGKNNANSYASVADADAYFADRAVGAWAGDESVKQAALIKATDYLDARFGARFIGEKASAEQALEWPRAGAGFLDSEVPVKLERACFEYAVRALTAELAPDLKVDASGLSLFAKKKKVGPIETEYAAQQSGLGSTPMLIRPYPAADMLLRGLLYSSNSVIR